MHPKRPWPRDDLKLVGNEWKESGYVRSNLFERVTHYVYINIYIYISANG